MCMYMGLFTNLSVFECIMSAQCTTLNEIIYNNNIIHNEV